MTSIQEILRHTRKIIENPVKVSDDEINEYVSNYQNKMFLINFYIRLKCYVDNRKYSSKTDRK